MGEYLQFVSIDLWTMIFTWANLIILFLLLKKFLFKPVNKVLSDRAAEIENTYKAAAETRRDAENMKDEYEKRISKAKSEADGIIKTAVEKADRRGENIVNEANEKARHLMEKAQKQIDMDKEKAVKEASDDIASMAVDVAEKLINKKLDASDDDKLISDIIDKM